VSKAQNPDIPKDREPLIKLIKRVAKKEQKSRVYDEVSLSTLLDRVAKALGYSNWSLFHKDVVKMSDARFDEIDKRVRSFPQVQSFIAEGKIDREAAKDEMREWVESNFTPLIEFAFYDNEAQNNFAWPSVDLYDELRDQFFGTYPDVLIDEVAGDMELNQGPWGVEDAFYSDESESQVAPDTP
jgi:hypothetical protein